MEKDTTKVEPQRDLMDLKNPNPSAAMHMGAGFAKKVELAEYLKVSSRNVTSIALSISLNPNRVGRFTWNDIWWRSWQIKNVPPQLFEEMKRPLLTNAELGVMLGMHERSIRRDGDRQDQLHDLPNHLNLSERSYTPARCRCGSVFVRSYDMAAHYDTTVVPARPYKPKDKAKAEGGVLLADRWILARLRKRAGRER